MFVDAHGRTEHDRQPHVFDSRGDTDHDRAAAGVNHRRGCDDGCGRDVGSDHSCVCVAAYGRHPLSAVVAHRRGEEHDHGQSDAHGNVHRAFRCIGSARRVSVQRRQSHL
jgi:hypothetical protein